MYIYSITFVVDPTIDPQWREWARRDFMEALPTEKLTICRVLDQQHQGHFTYSIQVPTEDMAQYQKTKELVDEKVTHMAQLFGAEKALHFTTLLKKTDL